MASSGKQWQCQLITPFERLAYLRNSGHLSDLTITFPGHSTVMQAHRLVLAMSSPVFEAMLYGPLTKGDTLALPKDHPQAFEWLLNHLYKDESELSDVNLAHKVYLLASKYQLDNVCKICSEVLSRYVAEEKFPMYFEFAILMKDQRLINSCETVLANNTDEVLRSSRVGALGRRALVLMLTHKKLFASTEILVFDALIRWGKAQLAKTQKEAAKADGASSMQGQGPQTLRNIGTSHVEADKGQPSIKILKMDADGVHKEEDAQEKRDCCPLKGSESEDKKSNTLRNVVKEFLPHIRFLTFSADDFVKHVIPSGVFTSDEAISVLMNIESLKNVPLPLISPCTSREQRMPHHYPYGYR